MNMVNKQWKNPKTRREKLKFPYIRADAYISRYLLSHNKLSEP